MGLGRKAFLLMLGYAIAVMLHVLALNKGWGLEPKSWMWIVGCGVVGPLFVRSMVDTLITKDKEE